MRRTVLFLDDGGVISDNERRGPQWQRLVGEYFAPRYGGSPGEWAEANRVFATALFEPAAWQARLETAANYRDFERTYFLDWLRGMFTPVGIPLPGEERSIEIAVQASAYITSRVRADFPGAVDAIRLLHARGYEMHTASGESSTDLEQYLSTLGVRGCFGRLYGVDLVDTLKAGPEFYRRILEDTGVPADEAVFVDDNPKMLSWVAEVGARTVLVTGRKAVSGGDHYSIDALADLPGVLGLLP